MINAFSPRDCSLPSGPASETWIHADLAKAPGRGTLSAYYKTLRHLRNVAYRQLNSFTERPNWVARSVFL